MRVLKEDTYSLFGVEDFKESYSKEEVLDIVDEVINNFEEYSLTMVVKIKFYRLLSYIFFIVASILILKEVM